MDTTYPTEDPKVKLGVGHHLRNGAGGEPRLEAVPKFKKPPDLPRPLCDDPQWQQRDFSSSMDTTNPTKDQKVKLGMGHHLRNGAGGEPRLEAVPKIQKTTQFAEAIVRRSTMATT